MKNTYFAEKFLHTLALLTCSMVLCTTYSTAQVFRKYIPPTDEGNRGRCIIRINTANDYLTVGDYYYQNTDNHGHAVWTDDDGVLLDQRNYHDGTAAKYDIRMIAPETVQGSYSTVFPYQPRYQGYPIVGTQIIAYGSPAVLVSVTWVAILNPTTKNIVWSHIIDNIADDSRGIAVVREDVNTFYVLSNLTNFTNPGRVRFAVTKYSWAPGDVGHQLLWSKEYDESADNAYFPASSMTLDGNDLVVTGTKNSTSQRVFAIKINKNTGNPGFMHYLTPSADNAKANSITFLNSGEYLIAGSTQSAGYTQPMLIKYDFSTNPTIYGYIIGADSIPGEFSYAKKYSHSVGSLSNPATENISAVGFLDNGEAIMMNVDDINLGTINWTTTFNDDYASGSSTVSKAAWFEADDGTGGNFMCTGTHSILSTGAISVLNGVVRKYDGFNECGNYPETEPDPAGDSQDTEEIESDDWFTTDPNTMDTLIPTLDPYYCSFGDTYYGKRSINEQRTIAGLPSITARYADNSIYIQYSLSQESRVEIILTDILGNIIAQETLYEQSGSHGMNYEAHHLSSGAYILNIRINDTRFTQHVSIIK